MIIAVLSTLLSKFTDPTNASAESGFGEILDLFERWLGGASLPRLKLGKPMREISNL
jgi:hypothetical protein